MKEQQIILFDGVCNLCNSSVQSIIRLDKKEKFVFAAIQSKSAKEFMEQYHHIKADSVILLKNSKAYVKSTAAIEIIAAFGGARILIKLAYLIPLYIRDKIYDFIAINRYKWFGKKDKCMIPSPELKKRFLD
jgi:predicted DCC family thiol-disulfide oxidoreductase YuxK